MTKKVRILGIDPGLRKAGWGVIESGSSLRFVASGTITPKTSITLAERLCHLFEGLMNVLECWSPHMAAVEETFLNNNPKSALTLGQARGICLLAPAHYGLPVSEYTANKIKKSVTGVGHAHKDQIQAMIRTLLPKAGQQTSDAADALAIAICHAHHLPLQTSLSTRLRAV